MNISKFLCEISPIGGIGIPSGKFIAFTEDSGARIVMQITDIMRINSIIEQYIPEGMSKEEYFEKLSKG